MRKSFFDYLIPKVNLDPHSGVEVAIEWKIVEVDKNPFHLPIPGDRGVKHFCLLLSTKQREVDSDFGEWWSNDDITPLRFYYSGYGTPVPEVFSDHIYNECRAAFLALDHKEYSRASFLERSEIDLKNVWRYLKALHKDYSSTPDFIHDYDYWHDRLYQTQKWIGYMTGDLDWHDGVMAIGGKLYEFLDLFDQFDR